jgi:hypothetical protein
MTQGMAWAMLQRRAKRAGIKTHICNHTFRATGITAFLRAGGLLERAAIIANHASTRTTQLYDRRSREIAWAEIEEISFWCLVMLDGAVSMVTVAARCRAVSSIHGTTWPYAR